MADVDVFAFPPSDVTCSSIVLALELKDIVVIGGCLYLGPIAALNCLSKEFNESLVQEGLITGAESLANDPPRNDFNQIVKLQPTSRVEPFDDSPFGRADATYVTLLTKQNALLEATLITFERLQGAIKAHSEPFVIRQSQALAKLLHQRADIQGRLQKTIARMQHTFGSFFLRSDVQQKLAQLAAQGFSADEIQLLQNAGLSPKDIQSREKFLQSLPPSADYNTIVKHGLEQWRLFFGGARAASQEMAEIIDEVS